MAEGRTQSHAYDEPQNTYYSELESTQRNVVVYEELQLGKNGRTSEVVLQRRNLVIIGIVVTAFFIGFVAIAGVLGCFVANTQGYTKEPQSLGLHSEKCPPKITTQAKEKNTLFKPGVAFSLPCVADGSPKPTYIWKKNDETLNIIGTNDRIVQVPDEGSIMFNSTVSTDEGIYQCFAINAYGVSVSEKTILRQAWIGNFEEENATSHDLYAGEPLVLSCIPPVSYPKPEISWRIMSPGGEMQAVNFTNRVSMDFEGRLRFTNVKKSDELGGRPYVCIATNSFLGSVSRGPEHYVNVRGGHENELKISSAEFWTSSNKSQYLKGDSLRLKCIFSGNPTPDVYWEKLTGDKTFPENRTEFPSFGQELWISDLQLSDSADYECMGYNIVSVIGSDRRPTKAYNISMESRPYWVDEPTDVIAQEGESATFVCRAEGIPTPAITWFINYVPLKNFLDPRINNERVTVSNRSSITMTNLTVKDRMNIQCNASNKHGYIWADVYLNCRDTASDAPSLYGGFIETFLVGLVCGIISYRN